MKPLKHLAGYAILSIMQALFVIACTNDANNNITRIDYGGTTETTSGNIFGKIWNDDGTHAKGVSVRLTPVDFNPYLTADEITIDSALTDDNGMYSFKLTSKGFFNVSAQSRGKFCYEDSIFGSEEGKNRVKDDTLKAPGSITGTAQLRPGDDNREIIILVFGTNTYARPMDSSGVFSISLLAKGVYKLRIATLQKDYGYFDTSVIVESGENTVIPGIMRLPFEGVPAVGPVAAKFDPHTMHVTLSWPQCDTSNIASFYVFRNTGITNFPFVKLHNADTSFDDDVLFLNPDSLKYHDTLRYSIAAFGKNRTFGKVSVAPDILLKNILTPIDTIPVSLGNQEVIYSWTVDKDHDVFLSGSWWIRKIDSIGQVFTYYNTNYGNPDNHYDYFSLKTDAKGNLYTICSGPGALMKFSSDLKLVSEKNLDDFLAPNMVNHSLRTNDNGLIYLVSDAGTEPIFIYAFDSTLSIVQFDSIPEFNWPQMYKDTFFFIEYPNGFSSPNESNVIKAYDIQCNPVRTWDVNEIINKYCPASFKTLLKAVDFTENNVSHLCFDNLFFPEMEDGDMIFIAIDSNNKLLGRYHVKCSRYVFDGVDRLYVYNYSKQLIYIYKIN